MCISIYFVVSCYKLFVEGFALFSGCNWQLYNTWGHIWGLFFFQTFFSILSKGCFSLFLCCLWKADQRLALNGVDCDIPLLLAVYLSYAMTLTWGCTPPNFFAILCFYKSWQKLSLGGGIPAISAFHFLIVVHWCQITKQYIFSCSPHDYLYV